MEQMLASGSIAREKSGGCVATGLGLIAGLVIVFVIYRAISDASPGSDAHVEVARVNVTAGEMVAAFHENEVAALKAYSRPIRISGIVSTVTANIADEPVVTLVSDTQEIGTMFGAQAHLSEDQSNFAAMLSKGDTISLDCDKVTAFLSVPVLSDCSPAG
jgi:hypothetical protein